MPKINEKTALVIIDKILGLDSNGLSHKRKDEIDYGSSGCIFD